MTGSDKFTYSITIALRQERFPDGNGEEPVVEFVGRTNDDRDGQSELVRGVTNVYALTVALREWGNTDLNAAIEGFWNLHRERLTAMHTKGTEDQDHARAELVALDNLEAFARIDAILASRTDMDAERVKAIAAKKAAAKPVARRPARKPAA